MFEFRVKWFTHDFCRYSEIVLVYNDYILNQWNENDSEKFNRFWDWFNGVEGVDLEIETLNQAICKAYQYQPIQKQ